MPSSIGRFLAALHQIVPAHRTADWDVSGLQLGDASGPAGTVAVCHEVTEAVAAAVEAQPVDLLVTYHPLLFRPTNRLVAGASPAGRALRLWRVGTAVAVAHTSFDTADGGTADALAGLLGLGAVTGFGPSIPAGQAKVVTFLPVDAVEAVSAAMTKAGAGTIGNYGGCSFRSPGVGTFTAGPGSGPVTGETGTDNREPETRLEMVAPASRIDEVVAALVGAHPYEEPAFDVVDTRSNLGFIGRVGDLPEAVSFGELAAVVGERLGAQGLRSSGAGTVARVAVVPGSGASFSAAARAAGAEVLVTGDVGHHTVREAVDRGMGVIDPGHAPSERPGMAALAEVVSRVCEETDSECVDLTSHDPTPWR